MTETTYDRDESDGFVVLKFGNKEYLFSPPVENMNIFMGLMYFPWLNGNGSFPGMWYFMLTSGSGKWQIADESMTFSEYDDAKKAVDIYNEMVATGKIVWRKQEKNS